MATAGSHPRVIVPLISFAVLVFIIGIGASVVECGAGGCQGSTDLALRRLNQCPAATQLLGSPIERTRLGCATGNFRVGNPNNKYTSAGYADADVPVVGPRGSGRYRFALTLAGDDWHVTRAVLQAGARKLDIAACTSHIESASNLASAGRTLARSCDAGDSSACLSLGAMHQHGSGVLKNPGQARAWYHKACELGNQSGCALRDQVHIGR